MTPQGSAGPSEAQTRACESHGAYESLRALRGSLWTGCPKCNQEANARDAAERHRRDRQDRILRSLDRSGIPPRFAGAAFDESLPPQLHEWIHALMAGKARGPALLVGHVGTGKTYAACAALAHAIRTDAVSGRFITPADYGRSIRDQWTARERTEGAIWREFARAPMLVLDDLGAQRTLDTELLQELINERYAADLLRATLITSNIAVDKLAAAIGERATDRIRDGSTVIRMTGVSRRQPA